MQGHSTPSLVAASTCDDGAISAPSDVGVPTAAPAALGTVARFVSAYGRNGEYGLKSGRVYRFMLQAGARDLLPNERVAVCLRRPIPGVASVDVLYSPRQQAAHYGGLQVCGSVWLCPVCSAKISERRREELSGGMKAWDGHIIMATFTLQHSLTDALVPLVDDLRGAVRKMRGCRAWGRFKDLYGLAGTVTGLEVTYNDDHGFHPHMHMLLFVRGGVDVQRLEHDLRAAWLAAVAKVGRYASPKWGLHVTAADADIAAYVAKWGKEPRWTAAHEMAKAGSKRGRGDSLSMLFLLEMYVVLGDARMGSLWREYAEAFKGKHQLQYSPGLRVLLGLVEEQKTDEELATEAVEDAVILAQLDMIAWRVVLANDARAELLEVASSGDVEQVYSYLARLGIEVRSVEDG